ncbi:MAG: Ribosomal RNA small subunit methyltransferase H [Candidatus Magasanikbacteria bacterium GW2011_GWC2_40_17]|uniref:Ribosomal RNA small subunit methyltransferase H n=1 Tax=Candidatus Magasanikbacteria bacterium GW2011_GWA2_42_32 TaxID=1619039 RepID=A0A0G1D4F4_9BACT|nr:MAG: Ribosomal RNA small subunit methyltransferase H [Candidatus Magasanikbacteria bacterium GW2011_GWC2_40_17]KKS56913.1 MAG: Ribosomal RNA small subunit methyltransferase H [Candidatus Magasanikbacteria bacterium GW2011_GWA2_42_32]OGH85517.1 MAG: 16S rRNA (cytosine(1402)-N(4))-methyltransferase [Candidatus Magasanikbacteria bacterium RIFOXYB2_FULL_38_10]
MHITVLLQEAVEGLNLKDGDKAVDCTLGDGGHSAEILKKIGQSGKLLSIDVDEENFARAREKFKTAILVNDNFVHLKNILTSHNFTSVQGILLDLGWSTTQFEESGRGFSFQRQDEPLDMRLGGESITAAEILNTWSEEEIGRILRIYGEEKKWRFWAEQIVERRKKKKFAIVGDLLELTGEEKKQNRLHPATKIFQALRIAVNDELKNLEETLPQALEALNSNGRLAVITFHSLEDRIVKNFFQKSALQGKIKIINKKPITASAEELKKNPRSRSAKLRIIEKI